MKDELETQLNAVAEHFLSPILPVPEQISGFACPKSLALILSHTGGFITKDRMFRFFGQNHDKQLPSIEQWNASEWKEAYGKSAENVLFVAEDIFGDQYGYRFEGNGERSGFIKFYCEGGEVEVIEGGINWFLGALSDPIGSGAVDGELLDALKAKFKAKKVWPKANQHIAFTLPLGTGGARDVSNLSIESVEVHLGVLSQL